VIRRQSAAKKIRCMEDIRVGKWVRAARRRLGLRQTDLASLAGVSAQTVMRLEQGRADGITLRTSRAIAAKVGIELYLVPRSIRGADIERQIDWRHAALIEEVIQRLTASGWNCSTEYSFNHFGDRGSVDVMASKPDRRALLILEIKSELRDVQDTLRVLDMKRRVVPGRVAADLGWRPRSIGTVLLMQDRRAERSRVSRHASTFDAALPARTVEVRRWATEPDGDLRGIWFLHFPETTPANRTAAVERVRAPGSKPKRSRRPVGVFDLSRQGRTEARPQDDPDQLKRDVAPLSS
jgi:transcriptional regulator with XRE-family HTH domain